MRTRAGGDDPDMSRSLAELLDKALTRQRHELREVVDAEVLQHACAASQDLQELQLEMTSAALASAVANLTEVIHALRRVVEREVVVDAQLVAEAQAAIARALSGEKQADPRPSPS